MKTVKLTTIDGLLAAERQTPGNKGIWDDYQFIVNSNVEVCDFWVVFEGVPFPQTVSCSRKNIIFITGEPYSKWHYHQQFLKQFGTVIAFQRDVKGENVIYKHPSESWSIGRKILTGSFKDIMTYDELKAVKTFKKDKLISVCVSNKAFYPMQVKRLEFVRKLSKKMDIDVFGTNISALDDKWDALYRYKYHIAIENFRCSDYFTCKLTDAFLGGTYPFYFGAPNILDYFPTRSLSPININNFDSAYERIKYDIECNAYEGSIKEIQVARDKILDEYNIFPSMVKLMNTMDADQLKEDVTIIPASKLQSLLVKIEHKIWAKVFLLKTKRMAERAIYELSQGRTKERKTR